MTAQTPPRRIGTYATIPAPPPLGTRVTFRRSLSQHPEQGTIMSRIEARGFVEIRDASGQPVMGSNGARQFEPHEYEVIE
jgi:hypothetical protein